jgi:hypothetical protein
MYGIALTAPGALFTMLLARLLPTPAAVFDLLMGLFTVFFWWAVISVAVWLYLRSFVRDTRDSRA